MDSLVFLAHMDFKTNLFHKGDLTDASVYNLWRLTESGPTLSLSTKQICIKIHIDPCVLKKQSCPSTVVICSFTVEHLILASTVYITLTISE